jgi:acyl-CoA thioesterase I
MNEPRSSFARLKPSRYARRRNIEVMKVFRSLACLIAAAVALSAGACGSRERPSTPAAGEPQARRTVPPFPTRPASAAPEHPASPAAGAGPRIVVLGDSLTAGLGLPAHAAYPSLLQERLTAQGLDYAVVNAGVSGDTSADALSRLDWALQGDVRVLVVALGGNDALRGLPVDQLRQNLAQIIERAQSRGIEVLLAGMEAPPNYGRDYIVSFHQVYPALATQYHVALVPFLLQGVAGIDALNQRDGIHPTAAGARLVADNVWAVLKPIAERSRQRRHDPSTGSGSPRATSRGEGRSGS